MRNMLTLSCLAMPLILLACKAAEPGKFETSVAQQVKQKITVGGKEWVNPTRDLPETIRAGGEHFQHHCQVCHGLDGHATGVPFAAKMDPPVPDLGSKEVQEYSDGQLKWIIENGIGPSGMPAWKGILEEEEMWHIVRYLRNLPPQGSLGVPSVYAEGETAHQHAGGGGEPAVHTHKDGKPHKH